MSAAARMYSSAPGSSGAIVTRTAAGRRARSSSTSGGRMQAAFWAPLRERAMCGPSRWMPGRRAPGTSRGAAQTRSRSSRNAVIVVGSQVVVPFFARKTAISAKSPSMVSSPRQPCAWMSTRPGTASRPPPSMSPAAGAPAASPMEATRPPSIEIVFVPPSKRTLYSFFMSEIPLRPASADRRGARRASRVRHGLSRRTP